MAPKGVDMKIIEDIKRLKSLGFSIRKISKCLGVHRTTVRRYFESPTIEKKITTLQVAIEPPSMVDELWASKVGWEKVRQEVLKGVSLKVIYDEHYLNGVVNVQYAAFWKQLQRRAPAIESTMVRIFPPGSRIEIDYADGIDIINLSTGEIVSTELFVGVLANSRYAFAEFTLTQSSENFLSSHVRMFEFFGGVAQIVSPDNLKSAVSKVHRYDPVINPAYTRLAAHYGFAVVPARVRRPTDKAIVERSIQIFQRWFYFLVRHRTFTSLAELNVLLRAHLSDFNKRQHRIFKKTREEMFLLEKQHLLPLPVGAYRVAVHEQAVLSRDCHLYCRKNYYSAPHGLRGKNLDVWISDKTIEILDAEGSRVALHGRSASHGNYITDEKHYPPACQAYLEMDIVKLKSWASDIGPEIKKLVDSLLSGPYPLQYLRRSQGILNLSRKYSRDALEKAAFTGNLYNQKKYQFLERVIQSQRAIIKEQAPIERSQNPNLRGLPKILH